MSTKELSNGQLFRIANNERLDASIRKAATDELTSRQLSDQELDELKMSGVSKHATADAESLSIAYKLLALTVPFFWIIHVLATSKYLALGKEKKWKTYWRYFCLGLIAWTVVVIFIGRSIIK